MKFLCSFTTGNFWRRTRLRGVTSGRVSFCKFCFSFSSELKEVTSSVVRYREWLHVTILPIYFNPELDDWRPCWGCSPGELVITETCTAVGRCSCSVRYRGEPVDFKINYFKCITRKPYIIDSCECNCGLDHAQSNKLWLNMFFTGSCFAEGWSSFFNHTIKVVRSSPRACS
jgi:hypothetical protein